jgi:hypothetical protein
MGFIVLKICCRKSGFVISRWNSFSADGLNGKGETWVRDKAEENYITN